MEGGKERSGRLWGGVREEGRHFFFFSVGKRPACWPSFPGGIEKEGKRKNTFFFLRARWNDAGGQGCDGMGEPGEGEGGRGTRSIRSKHFLSLLPSLSHPFPPSPQKVFFSSGKSRVYPTTGYGCSFVVGCLFSVLFLLWIRTSFFSEGKYERE